LACGGIGPETADSILLYALGRPVFVVDAYTRRIFSRYGLIAGGEPYESLRALLESALPRSPRLYNEYHALLVRLAKVHCRHQPVCDSCPLA
jgi:endonuclease-3 related protein